MLATQNSEGYINRYVYEGIEEIDGHLKKFSVAHQKTRKAVGKNEIGRDFL